MATEIWVNIGSGNGLLPDGTKPFSQEITQPAINKIRLKITNLNFHPNFPGANELKKFPVSVLEGLMNRGKFWNCHQGIT